ncbi:hypothetical protein CISG_10415, partial [Coccidioides immitis RMSCC 3703]
HRPPTRREPVADGQGLGEPELLEPPDVGLERLLLAADRGSDGLGQLAGPGLDELEVLPGPRAAAAAAVHVGQPRDERVGLLLARAPRTESDPLVLAGEAHLDPVDLAVLAGQERQQLRERRARPVGVVLGQRIRGHRRDGHELDHAHPGALAAAGDVHGPFPAAEGEVDVAGADAFEIGVGEQHPPIKPRRAGNSVSPSRNPRVREPTMVRMPRGVYSEGPLAAPSQAPRASFARLTKERRESVTRAAQTFGWPVVTGKAAAQRPVRWEVLGPDVRAERCDLVVDGTCDGILVEYWHGKGVPREGAVAPGPLGGGAGPRPSAQDGRDDRSLAGLRQHRHRPGAHAGLLPARVPCQDQRDHPRRRGHRGRRGARPVAVQVRQPRRRRAPVGGGARGRDHRHHRCGARRGGAAPSRTPGA